MLLDWHRRLISIRRSLPDLGDPRLEHVHVATDEDDRWLVLHRGGLAVVAAFGPEGTVIPMQGTPVNVLLASDPGFSFSAGRVELPGESVALVQLL
jgi:maltooligosyltrehalose trehalohydrolase